MNKTLEAIQKIINVLRIITQIVFILCIVGAIACAVGISLMCMGLGMLDILGGDVSSFVSDNFEGGAGVAVAEALVGIFECVGSAIVIKMANTYFKHELEAGTPFTYEGAEELKKLGIFTIVIPIATAVMSAVSYEIVMVITQETGEPMLSNGLSITTGLFLIFISLVLKSAREIMDGRSGE